MPQVVRVQVNLTPSFTPKESIMNTWHCVTVGATTPLVAVTSFVAALNTFYQAVDAVMGQYVGGHVPFARGFDLSDPKPRQPIYETSLTVLTTATTWLPREIACCISYKGTYLSGVSPRRKRGRIYIGPLASTSIDLANDGLFTSTFVSTLASAADALLGTSDASSEFRWVVYSPTSDPTGEGNDAACWDAVTEGWVDENPDIQRRRSHTGGARSLFS